MFQNYKNNHKVSHAELLSRMLYNPETGRFTSLLSNKEVGCLQKRTGYRSVSIPGGKVQEHRLAWFYTYGHWPEGELDHINRDKTDNRISNLRILNRSSQMLNSRYTEEKGYIWTYDMRHKNPRGYWRVQPTYKGKRVSLGNYEDERDAELCYKLWVAMRKEVELGESTPCSDRFNLHIDRNTLPMV
jgi:hypothetical protein